MIMPILSVSDVDASIAFYKDQLGFRHDMSMSPEGKTVFAIVGWGQAVAIGLSLDPKSPIGAPGVQFMIYVPDELNIDTYYNEVKARGVAIKDELVDSYWGDRTFSVNDPDGYWLTIATTVKQVPVEDMEAHIREQ